MKNENIKAAQSPEKSEIKERVAKTQRTAGHAGFLIAAWEKGDEKLPVTWNYYPTGSGEVLIASTEKGICFLGFGDEQRDFALSELNATFPDNPLNSGKGTFHEEALERIAHPQQEAKVHLHLKGTAFQLKVWEKIMTVPFGGLATYASLGENSRDARAVGTAVGANPVCLIVGCHRIVHTDGNIQGYHYGDQVKAKLLALETA